ncbi:hypothetical protein JY651_46635 [Pyxidicoccus parkwayensis]|uniref:Uncharacterized protein n=1 Tax=Pyxidicoccus parkwayensis TaxID=2813578 RepID=A0ABX7NVL2_9BACT|nr:hypothetical protein [Pyxidicoccus parkwaysis]QSQ22513.1 hypothetical protein JY651_46635 [Pyxidicoccus parkwaysis]
MALAKKGSRLLTLEQGRFRWTVAPADEPGLGIVAEDADAPGQRMVAWVEHDIRITPWVVREAILHALAHGWQPRARGAERVFRLETRALHRARGAWLSAKLESLCDVFEARLPSVEGVRDLNRHGERAIAFEHLCGHFFDADTPPTLSLHEFEQVASLGEELGCHLDWVWLIARLEPADRPRIPRGLRTLATRHLTGALAREPSRREAHQRLLGLLEA